MIQTDGCFSGGLKPQVNRLILILHCRYFCPKIIWSMTCKCQKTINYIPGTWRCPLFLALTRPKPGFFSNQNKGPHLGVHSLAKSLGHGLSASPRLTNVFPLYLRGHRHLQVRFLLGVEVCNVAKLKRKNIRSVGVV